MDTDPDEAPLPGVVLEGPAVDAFGRTFLRGADAHQGHFQLRRDLTKRFFDLTPLPESLGEQALRLATPIALLTATVAVFFGGIAALA